MLPILAGLRREAAGRVGRARALREKVKAQVEQLVRDKGFESGTNMVVSAPDVGDFPGWTLR